jgi:hypothetical protein
LKIHQETALWFKNLLKILLMKREVFEMKTKLVMARTWRTTKETRRRIFGTVSNPVEKIVEKIVKKMRKRKRIRKLKRSGNPLQSLQSVEAQVDLLRMALCQSVSNNL